MQGPHRYPMVRPAFPQQSPQQLPQQLPPQQPPQQLPPQQPQQNVAYARPMLNQQQPYQQPYQPQQPQQPQQPPQPLQPPPTSAVQPVAQPLHMAMANLSVQPQNGIPANGHMNPPPPTRPVGPGIRPQPPLSGTPQMQSYQEQATQPPQMQPPLLQYAPGPGAAIRPPMPQSSQPQPLQPGAPPIPAQQPPQQSSTVNAQMQARPLRPMNIRPAPGTIPTRPVPDPYANPTGAQPQQPQLQPQGQVPQPQLQPPQGQQQQRQAPQISPLIVPRPSHKVCGKPRTYYYRGMANLPDERGMTIPYSNAEFISVDDGSARLRFARLTTNVVASEPNTMTKSCVPFAILLTPFANQAAGEAPVPVVDYSDKQVGGPLRCERCNAYANPGFKFINGGQELQCNLCSAISKTPPQHFSPISHTGQRMDIESRPELRYGSVEYLVGSPDYWVRPPQPAKYIFAFDVSSGAITSGLSAAAMLSVKSAISAGLVPGTASDGARIAIMTFDKALHFFDARGADEDKSVRMQFVPDILDPFVPIGGNALFLTTGEAVAAIESAMEMHNLTPGGGGPNADGNMNGDAGAERQPAPAECALGSALHTIKEAFADYGGKAFVIAGSIPTAGVNKLERRGGGAVGGGEEREMALLREANSDYDVLGCELAEVQASVDLFLAPSSVYIDASTLSRVPRACGGRMHLYTGFDAVRDGASFHRAICTAASEPRAFEALMRVRTSPGIEPRGEYIGHFGRPQRGDDVSGPVFDVSSTIGLEMAVVSKLTADGNSDGRNRGGAYYGNSGNTNNFADDACVQCAILFTDSTGRRRIRVHTVFARKSSVMADLFSCADVDATATFLAKRVASAVLVGRTGFSKAWDGVMEKMAQMFYMYRKHCTSSSVSGQLILPESFKVLPLMMLGLIKSSALRKNGPGGESVTVDERASALSFLLCGTIAEVAAFCYPRVWELQDLPKEAGIPLPPPQEPGVVPEENGADGAKSKPAESSPNELISLPDTVAATAATLADDKILLMENGMQLVLWVGAQLKESGAKAAAEISTAGPGGRMLMRGETANSLYYVKETGDVGKRVAAIIQRICSQRKFLSRPVVVERANPGAGGEGKWVLPMLVEDRGAGGMYSYMEYLRVVHKEVMDRMANDSAQSDLATWEMLNHGY